MSKFLPSRRPGLGLEPSPPFTAPQLTLIRSGTWATEVEVFTLFVFKHSTSLSAGTDLGGRCDEKQESRPGLSETGATCHSTY